LTQIVFHESHWVFSIKKARFLFEAGFFIIYLILSQLQKQAPVHTITLSVMYGKKNGTDLLCCFYHCCVFFLKIIVLYAGLWGRCQAALDSDHRGALPKDINAFTSKDESIHWIKNIYR
jgi:hypothetical protein